MVNFQQGVLSFIYGMLYEASKNGVNKATISGETVTTDDGVTCTIASADNKLTVTCTGTSEEFDAPELAEMTLGTASAQS